MIIILFTVSLALVHSAIYFPPNFGTWGTISPSEVGWNPSLAVQRSLQDFLISTFTKSFILLAEGKIVFEWYFDGHNSTTLWAWNSAGKTLTAAVIGIAQSDGKLQIGDSVAQYLGVGWTSETPEQELNITLRHLLTMTSGIDDVYDCEDYLDPPHLIKKASAGARWAYDGVFLKLQDVVSSATTANFNDYFNTRIVGPIGMSSSGRFVIENTGNGSATVYYSNTRSMARFGLLASVFGIWDGKTIVDPRYFYESTTSSQNLNQAYGYLWWLNGQNSYMVPGVQKELLGEIVPKAPPDMFFAWGKSKQKIYIAPTQKMVVVRMGQEPYPKGEDSSDPMKFDNELWIRIAALYS